MLSYYKLVYVYQCLVVKVVNRIIKLLCVHASILKDWP